MKTAIVCTAFGTARPESLAPFTHIEEQIKSITGIESVSFAFTSGFVRKRLADSGIVFKSPAELVAHRLESFERVIVQPFQIVAGGEYEKTVEEIRSLPQSERCQFGSPLIRDRSDIPAIVDLLIERKSQFYAEYEGLVVAGHGNGDHETDSHYIELDRVLSMVNPHFATATLETKPSLDSIIERLSQRNCKSVAILPLLFSAGKHVTEDIAGDTEHSWISKFKLAGIEAKADLKGLSEIDSFVQIWMDRIKGLV